MKKDKQSAQEKAQRKENRKKSEKAVKAVLIDELTKLVSTFAEPNKKLKKLIEKAATSFSREIDKTAKPIFETQEIKTEETKSVVAEKKPTKPRTSKKTEKEATK